MYREKKFLEIISARQGSQSLWGKNSRPLRGDLAMATRCPDNKKAYVPYGVAYTTKTETLRAEATIYANRTTWAKSRPYQR